MSRLISAPILDDRPRRLASVAPDRHDPVVREMVERAASEAYDRGRADGVREGEATAAQHADRIAASVAAALTTASRQVTADRDACAREAVELAVAIAGAVLRREPHDGGEGVATAVRDVLGQLADPTPAVLVHPDDQPLVADALADLGVTVQPDPGLEPGDARVRGGWAEVDLTRTTAWSAVVEALDGI